MWLPILSVRQSLFRFFPLGVVLGLAGTPCPAQTPDTRSPSGVEASGLPRIGRSDTVVHFRAERLGPIPAPVMVKIFNESDVGILHWDIFSDRSWISTSPDNANGNETDVAIWIVNTDAGMGHHSAHLVIESNNAVNSPETMWVELDMVCPVPITGDVNDDGRLSQSDIIYMVNHVLRGGPLPVPVWQAGDVNCDETLSQSDIIVLVNHLLRGGPSPCNVCQFF